MGKYRSVQSIMIAEALKGITDNQTITAYKKDCKKLAAVKNGNGTLYVRWNVICKAEMGSGVWETMHRFLCTAT